MMYNTSLWWIHNSNFVGIINIPTFFLNHVLNFQNVLWNQRHGEFYFQFAHGFVMSSETVYPTCSKLSQAESISFPVIMHKHMKCKLRNHFIFLVGCIMLCFWLEQGSFWVWAQAMRGGATIWHLRSLVEPITRMIPAWVILAWQWFRIQNRCRHEIS